RPERHSSTSSSTQSTLYVTAFFQLRQQRSHWASCICGSQRLSSAQFATTSCPPCQYPPALPAAYAAPSALDSPHLRRPTGPPTSCSPCQNPTAIPAA